METTRKQVGKMKNLENLNDLISRKIIEFPHRGRIVPEMDDPNMREIFRITSTLKRIASLAWSSINWKNSISLKQIALLGQFTWNFSCLIHQFQRKVMISKKLTGVFPDKLRKDSKTGKLTGTFPVIIRHRQPRQFYSIIWY